MVVMEQLNIACDEVVTEIEAPVDKTAGLILIINFLVSITGTQLNAELPIMLTRKSIIRMSPAVLSLSLIHI